MTSRDFCYWLQGYFEIYSAGIYGSRTSESLTGIELSPKHVAAIQKHLNMVLIINSDGYKLLWPSDTGYPPVEDK